MTRPVRVPYVNFSIEVGPLLHEQLTVWAIEDGVHLNTLVCSLIAAAVKAHESVTNRGNDPPAETT